MSAKKITPVCYDTRPGKWPFILTADLVIDLGLGMTGDHLYSHRGRNIATLKGDILRIFEGYASDGASPYFGTIFGLRIGTPSHRKTAAGFFTHDFLYQAAETRCCPWTYEEADDVLYHLMRAEGSRLGGLYHGAVAVFGGLHRHLTRGPTGAMLCISNHRMQ